MKILFSPVGMTDPMTIDKTTNQGYHDGALLHICRHEQPDLVHLYLSKETLDLDALDGRYTKSMELMQEYLHQQGRELRIEHTDRPDLVEVQLFDQFLTDFQTILTQYRQQYPEAEILVNVSSGTPAMKSALQILAAANDIGLRPVQVRTPARAANNKNAESRDIPAEWAQNLDAKPDAVSRLSASEHINLLYAFNKKLLISLIRNYDYKAAGMTANSMTHLLSPEFKTLLDAAIKRSELKSEQAARQIWSLGYTDIMDDTPDQTAEYFLLLDLYIRKKSYTDYLRAITPFVIELFYQATEKQCGITLTDYTVQGNRFFWDKYKLSSSPLDGKFHQKPFFHKGKKQYCNSYMNGKRVDFPQDHMLSWHLTNLCENLSRDNAFIFQTLTIREFEFEIRNLAAHTIRSFTEQEIKRETGYTPAEIQEKVFLYLRDYTDIPVTADTRQQYDRMNETLISLL